MGRKKLPTQLIAERSSRDSTFSKRRTGLMKKARELSVLCQVDVAVVVHSAGGRRYEFPNGDSLAKILERYKNHTKAEGKVPTEGSETEASARFTSHKSCLELVKAVERKLEEPHVEQLGVSDLIQLEEELEAALTYTRSIKTKLTTKPAEGLKQKLASAGTGEDEAGTSSQPLEEPRFLQFL